MQEKKKTSYDLNSIILNIEQIIKSENKFIAKFSKEKIFTNASNAIFNFLKRYKNKKILFICGPGNNGKDGVLVHNICKKKLIDSEIYLIDKKKKISQYEIIKIKKIIKKNDIIIDCIFGIGFKKLLNKEFVKFFKLINSSKKKIISIDLPSGINANTGEFSLSYINPDITLVMGFYKPAHFLIPSKHICGEKILLKLNLEMQSNLFPEIKLIKKNFFVNYIPSFNENVHKYNKGHVLVIGGKMSGASRIVALSSRKTGAGLSSINIQEKDLKYYCCSEPGTIIKTGEITNMNFRCMVIGPGLGDSYDIYKIINLIEKVDFPIIIDADALSIFQNDKKKFYNMLRKKKNVVITPHEGEFKRLFEIDLKDKILGCLEASKKIQNPVILKGNDTIISFPNGKIWINDNARSSLATAGSGDLLCGILSGLISQEMDFEKSLIASVWIHGQLSQFKNNTTVEDFIKYIPRVFRQLKK